MRDVVRDLTEKRMTAAQRKAGGEEKDSGEGQHGSKGEREW